MNEGVIGLFTAAVGLCAPWNVEHVSLDAASGQIELGLQYAAAAAPCSHCGAPARVGGRTQLRCWRHGDILNFEALLYAEVPLLRCVECGREGPVMVAPWHGDGWIEKELRSDDTSELDHLFEHTESPAPSEQRSLFGDIATG